MPPNCHCPTAPDRITAAPHLPTYCCVQLPHAMSSRRNYEEICIIGRGAYGTVFKAKDTVNDRVVALKRVCIVNNTEEKGVPVSTLREITLLKQLDNMLHPNIVRMFDAFQTFKSASGAADGPPEVVLTIVFEHVEQDLSMFIHKSQPCGLTEDVIKNLMQQLLCGVDYLHTNRMIHRDIKPQNILITKNKQVKIADFGLARVYGFCKLVTSVVVTLWYRAPEILLRAPYAMMVDLWSVGAIMAEMYNRRPLFRGVSDVNQLQSILSIIGSPVKSDWPEQVALSYDSFQNYQAVDLRTKIPDMCEEGIDLISKLLLFDPSRRINARKCLAHRYFDDIDAPDSQDSGIGHELKSFRKIPSEYRQDRCNPLLTRSPVARAITINVDDEIPECEIVLPCTSRDVSSREDGSSRGSDSGLGNLTKHGKDGSDVERLNESFHDTSFHEACDTIDENKPTDNCRTLIRSDSGLGVSPHRIFSNDTLPKRTYCEADLSKCSGSSSSDPSPSQTKDATSCPTCTYNKTKDVITFTYNKNETSENTTTNSTSTCTSTNFHSYIIDKENMISPVRGVHDHCEKRQQPNLDTRVPSDDDLNSTINPPPAKRFRSDETTETL